MPGQGSREQEQSSLVEESGKARLINESLARLFFEQLVDGVLIFNDAGSIVEANQSASDLLGFPREHLLQMTLSELFATSVHGLDQGSRVYRQTGREVGEMIFHRPDGQRRGLEYSVFRIVDGLYAVTFRDITGQNQMAQVLLQRSNELDLLRKISEAFISSLSLDGALSLLLEEVQQTLHILNCSIWLVDRETQELVCRQLTVTREARLKGSRLAPGQGILGSVARHGQSLLIADVRTDPRYDKTTDQHVCLQARSLLALPLKVGESTIGVLCVGSRDVGRFTEADLALLEPFVDTAAVVIEIGWLCEQAHHDAQTRTMLLREVNHRVGNNLTMIMGLIDLETRRVLQGEARFRAALKDLQSRIASMNTVHFMLSETTWTPLDLYRLVTEVVRTGLDSAGKPHQLRVVATSRVRALRLDHKQALIMALVLNELTTNSTKYAFRDRAVGRIYIRISMVPGSKQVRLEFRDNGPGWPEDVLQGERADIGLQLVRLNVFKALRGDLELYNKNGAGVIITFTPAPIGEFLKGLD